MQAVRRELCLHCRWLRHYNIEAQNQVQNMLSIAKIYVAMQRASTGKQPHQMDSQSKAASVYGVGAAKPGSISTTVRRLQTRFRLGA